MQHEGETNRKDNGKQNENDVMKGQEPKSSYHKHGINNPASHPISIEWQLSLSPNPRQVGGRVNFHYGDGTVATCQMEVTLGE